MEILAPCGNMESFKSAINAGTDAVYLGMKRFSARDNADNFDFDGLKSVVEQCRICGVKVYLAFNTLVYDDELPQLNEYISNAAECGINAVIAQDLATAEAVRRVAPQVAVHASTQMSVTSCSGVRALSELGFSRVVLARELSYDEIRGITAEACKLNIETEVFVHGAHCVSMSGQCYMSSLFGGRSGNRGICAQPCRLDVKCGERHYALSLKDFSVIRHIPRLEEIGVTSAKIEGRMKRPEYVAAAVDACRKALRGELELDKGTMDLLERLFSRNGFSDGYFTGNYCGMFGVRSKDDVIASGEALKEIKNRFKQPYKRYTLDFFVKVKKELPVECRAILRKRGNGKELLSVTALGEIPEKAVNNAVTSGLIKSHLEKLGGTIYSIGEFVCEVDEGLMLKISQINRLKRDCIDGLSRMKVVKND